METLHRKARRGHKCLLCNGTIPIGEEYIYQNLKMCGALYDNRYHLICYELMDLLAMDYDSEGISDDDFYEYIYDYIRYEINTHDLATFVYQHIKTKGE